MTPGPIANFAQKYVQGTMINMTLYPKLAAGVLFVASHPMETLGVAKEITSVVTESAKGTANLVIATANLGMYLGGCQLNEDQNIDLSGLDAKEVEDSFTLVS